MDRQNPGGLIRETRLQLGLTQEQLSDGICDPATLSRIENGYRNAGSRILCQLMERIGLDPTETPFSADPVFFWLDSVKREIRAQLLAERLSEAERLLAEHHGWLCGCQNGGANEVRFEAVAMLLLEGMRIDRQTDTDPLLVQSWNRHAVCRAAAVLQSAEQDSTVSFVAGSDGFPELTEEETIRWIETRSAHAASDSWEQMEAWNAMAVSLLALREPVIAVRIWTALLQSGLSRDSARAAVKRTQKAALCANLAVSSSLLGQDAFAADYARRAERLLYRSDAMNLWSRIRGIRRAVKEGRTDGRLLIRML